MLATSLAEVLARFRDDSRGGVRRVRGWERDDPTPDSSFSSQDEHSARGRRRPLRNNEDDLTDMKFDPLEFECTLNLDVYLEWIQSSERLFEVKGYSNEKSFKVAILELKKCTSLWYESNKRQRPKEGK